MFDCFFMMILWLKTRCVMSYFIVSIAVNLSSIFDEDILCNSNHLSNKLNLCLNHIWTIKFNLNRTFTKPINKTITIVWFVKEVTIYSKLSFNLFNDFQFSFHQYFSFIDITLIILETCDRELYFATQNNLNTS